MSERILAASDCEHCRPGPISQPANTVSSLAYVAAGAAMAAAVLRRPADQDRALDLAYAASVTAVGLGSVAYHGPGGRLGKWAHDASLESMLLLTGVRAARLAWPRLSVPAAALAAVPVVSVGLGHPRITESSQAVLGIATVTGQVARGVRSRRDGGTPRRIGTLAIFGAGAALHALGRTGGPLCRPHSLLQPHAAWHALSALALWQESVDVDRSRHVATPGGSN